jgi:transcriptional regulator with XRE-family HTH domain
MLNDETHSVETPTTDRSGEIALGGKQYLTPAQLAKTLGISPRTLARWHATRAGPPRIKILKLVLYDVSKLPEWLAGATGPLPTPARNDRQVSFSPRQSGSCTGVPARRRRARSEWGELS